MKAEISAKSKKAIEDKLFFKFVSFNKANEEEIEKTIALTNFLKEDGERIMQSEKAE
tara:strand:- start:63 stop:233 length:171 start_codon:yes stop_codon:yes gene_type:complete